MKKLTILFAILLVMLMGSVAHAELSLCNIKDLDCWGEGKKCNIKFRNKTGLGSGSGAGDLYQVSDASTAKVSARKSTGDRAGGNTLKIDAGSSSTMNLDKKDLFFKIKIKLKRPVLIEREDFVENAYISCGGIRQILNGSGVCKVFMAKPDKGDRHMKRFAAFNCDGGNVMSTKP